MPRWHDAMERPCSRAVKPVWPDYVFTLFSAFLRFTPSGLTRIFVPDEYFVNIERLFAANEHKI